MSRRHRANPDTPAVEIEDYTARELVRLGLDWWDLFTERERVGLDHALSQGATIWVHRRKSRHDTLWRWWISVSAKDPETVYLFRDTIDERVRGTKLFRLYDQWILFGRTRPPSVRRAKTGSPR